MAEEQAQEEKIAHFLPGQKGAHSPEANREEKEDEHEAKSIASRGIPSKDSLYLPPYNSPELRNFQDSNENITRNIWNLDEVMNFVFPHKYQEKYSEVAVSFIKLLLERNSLTGDEIGHFVSSHGISKATFYNRVLPRLKRIGMLKVERQTLIAVESKRKFRPMTISLSKTFGNYLTKIGDSWLAIVDDARSKKEVEKRTEK